MKQTSPPPRPSRITIPKHCHPAVKIVFSEMRRQGLSYEEVEHRSGVLKTTIKQWRCHNAPGLDTLTAVLGALSWDLAPIPPAEVLTPEVRAQLARLAVKHGLDEEALLSQLVREVANRPLNTVGHSRGRNPRRKKAA